MALKLPDRSALWFFTLGLVSLWVGSLLLRFWDLGRFNTLVFDEVYYVKFAHNYLSQTPFFDGHPPLSKYLIAIGMWLGNQLPFGRDAINTEAGAAYSSWSYRWLNAVLGSFIPLVLSGIAYQLTRRYSYAFLVAFLAALDGMALVESRYGLNNVHLVLFGLLGLWFLLLALNGRSAIARNAWLAMAGIAFGASASVKWNGLWFLLGAYGLWIAAWVIRWAGTIESQPTQADQNELAREAAPHSPIAKLTRISIWQWLLNLAVVPFVFYFLIWIPHLQLNAKAGIWQDFWTLQQQILGYHERVGSGTEIHPYCSTWYSWLLMLRPVAYFYQVTAAGAPLPTGKSTLPPTPGRLIYDVHSMGNPILWVLSSAAIVIILAMLVQQWVGWITQKQSSSATTAPEQSELAPTELWVLLFIAVNYLANLLPWVRITRCIFLYHYMGAAIFASMAIAWLLDRWFQINEHGYRLIGIATVLLIVLAFLYWMPVYLGLPLSPEQFRARMWVPSWI